MSNKLKIKIQEKQENIDDIYNSLLPEQGEIEGRSKVRIYKDEDENDNCYIYIKIKSPDLVSLRASLNSWLKLYQTAQIVSNL